MTKIDNQSKHDEEQNSIHDRVHQAIIELDVGACEADEKTGPNQVCIPLSPL